MGKDNSFYFQYNESVKKEMKGKNLKRNLLPNQSHQSPLLTSSLYTLLFASIASMEIHSPLLNTFNSVEWPKQNFSL